MPRLLDPSSTRFLRDNIKNYIVIFSFACCVQFIFPQAKTFNDAASAFEFIYKTKTSTEVIELSDKTLRSNSATAYTKSQAAYWGGRASEDQGLYLNAERLYIVSINYGPGWWEPLIRLFRVYLNTHQYEKGKRLIENTNKDYIPEFVINHLRFELSKTTGEAFTNFDYNFNIAFDSNINQGIDTDTVSYFGFLFKTDPESKPISSLGYKLNLGYYSNWVMLNQRKIGIALIADNTDFKSDNGDISSAKINFNLSQGKDWTSNINVGSKWYRNNKLFDFLSTDLIVNNKISSGINFFISPQFGTYKYKNLNNYSGKFQSVSFGYQFFNKRISNSLLKLSRYAANDPVFSFKEIGLGFNLSYPRKFVENINVYSMKQRYKLLMIEFNKRRIDRMHRLDINFRQINLLNEEIKFKLTYERNESNIKIFERDRWSLEWSMEF